MSRPFRLISTHMDAPVAVGVLAAALALIASTATLALTSAKGNTASLDAMLWAGAILFTLYAPAALCWSRSTRPVIALLVALYGLAFPLWSSYLGVFGAIAGYFGLPHAILTAAVLALAARSRVLGLLPFLMLGPAWFFAVASIRPFEWIGVLPATTWSPGDRAWIALAILWWNVCMAGAMSGWAVAHRRTRTTTSHLAEGAPVAAASE